MRFTRLSAVLMTVVGLAAGSAFGSVGVCERCPVPTPCPPAGAGAGNVRNGGFEQSFSKGAAEQWVRFKSSSYKDQVHFAGADRAYSGRGSQKLILPPPPSAKDENAGVYQQIWVVPGATYTANVRVYLEPPPEQSYDGEDVVAWIGLDPYGQARGGGSGTIWSAGEGMANQWLTLTTTVRAVAPVMTVSLVGTRKSTGHGRDARVWFDDVVISGQTPTGVLPGPEPEPIDPEMFVPRTFGGNLVGNPSFEQPFTGGLSSGWNKWSTGGTGTWRQSLRVGKIGGGRYDCGSIDGLAEMNPKTILLYGGTPSPTDPNDAGGNGVYGDVVELANDYPQLQNTIIVGRPALNENWETYRISPTYYGRQLADQLWVKQRQFPRIDCWQGLSEPDTREDWQAVLIFEKAMADRAHELGMKVCSLNLASDEPANDLRMVDETFSPSCRDLLAVADYLGHHCRGGPRDELMVINQSRDDACANALRPRRFRDMYERRGWRFPPVIATEGSTHDQWHGSWRPETIANDLTTLGTYINTNRWWCGYAHFVAGGSCRWEGFDIVGQGDITRNVGAWNANNPADAADGLFAQMFGAGRVHPRSASETTPGGRFNGGINRQVSGLVAGQSYLLACWMKYEFRGHQPVNLKFNLGVDSTAQISNGNAATIDWGTDQIAEKAPVHEVYSHAWRTFTAGSPTVSIWLRAEQAVADPSFMFYVDGVEVRLLNPDRTYARPEAAPRGQGGT